jgi:hypothetical protein
MYFNLQSDTGNEVIGYVVPDSFSDVPNIRVCSNGEELLVFAANEVREGLVAAGRHETGVCGFRIDVAMLPSLAELQNLELTDADSGVLIYRRLANEIVHKKVLRLETHLLPLWRLDNALERRFQYFARSAEKFGFESVTQMFLLSFLDSIFVSGRILYKNYAYYIEDRNFNTVILIQDPYQEMAERLMVLSKLGEAEVEQLGMRRESMGMSSAIEFAKALPMENEKALERAFRSMPPDVAVSFANPLVRQLTTSTLDEMPRRGAVAGALDLLSSCALVGLRHEPETFLLAMSELLGIERAALPPVPQFPQVASLGHFLKESRAVDALLEKDCELYHFVSEAYKKLG